MQWLSIIRWRAATRWIWPQLRDERFIVSTMEPGQRCMTYIVRRVADYSTYPDVTDSPC